MYRYILALLIGTIVGLLGGGTWFSRDCYNVTLIDYIQYYTELP